MSENAMVMRNCFLSRILAKAYVAPLLPLILTSCDLSRELNENTLAISTTVSQIHNQQIYENLQSFINDPYTVPAQVVLTGGGVQVTNSATPSFGSFLKVWPNLSGSYTNSYTQNWAVAPVNDPDDVRRLRALYRLAVYGNNGDRAQRGGIMSGEFYDASKDVNFDAEYPRIVLSDTSSSVTTTSQSSLSPEKKPKSFKLTAVTRGRSGTDTMKLLNPDSDCSKDNPNPNCPTNPYYYPTVDGTVFYPKTSHLTGDQLEVPHDWLFWSVGLVGAPVLPYPPKEPNFCKMIWPAYFSTIGPTHHTLYTCSTKGVGDAQKKLDTFSLWVWGATPNSLGSSGSGGGGGGGGGGSGGGKGSKGAPASVLTSPTGGHG